MEKEPGSAPRLLLPCSEGREDGEQRGGRQSRSAQARARGRTQHGRQLSKSGTGTARLCPGTRAGDSMPSNAPAHSPKAFHRKSYPKQQSATPELLRKTGQAGIFEAGKEKQSRAGATRWNRGVGSGPAPARFDSHAGYSTRRRPQLTGAEYPERGARAGGSRGATQPLPPRLPSKGSGCASSSRSEG